MSGSPVIAPELSLVVPVFNEEDAIPIFLERVPAMLDGVVGSWEMIFVNDGSRDGTLACLRRANAADPRVKIVDFSRNFGKEIALTAGLDHAMGRAVVPIDVDLQDPPEVIAQLVARWREGFDVVLAARSDRSHDSMPKRVTADLFYRVMNRLSNVPLPSNVGDFRLMDRAVVDVLVQYRERERFMKGLFASLGFRQTTVYYARPERSAGETKFRPLRLWGLAVEGIISFSTKPLKIWTYMGIVCTVLAFAYLLLIIIRTLILGIDAPGYASLMSVMLFMNGIILTGLGVVGEYIARIFNEVKGRPLYIVREQIGDLEPGAEPVARRGLAVSRREAAPPPEPPLPSELPAAQDGGLER